MSIIHMSSVRCDGCGDPSEQADDAKGARQLAQLQGYVREGNQDICPRCKELPVAERPWVKNPPILYVDAI
jgi:hypothetical protein